ncbi:DUF4133 domain-containing protein [Riemerella columbipharyngis]|uniref:DUF4133 domain-containing protein n=1 Tax=Riemerella columbipharyngis TaxID=1071918 RepID=A0A1G6ZD97_9FLAO|nr:DUF4133 domain-containing protein [Riemerella columbipharyngis]SDD99716.1 hypothetical protein SAMN05421544_10223 [Riemerella columbipharyngis]
MGYYLYKGLKKPLVLFGLKDKYIYQAIGSAVGTIVISVFLSNIIGFLGMLASLGAGGLVVWMIYKKQDKKGLYNKKRNDGEIHIVPSRMKTKIINKKYEKQKV